MRTDKDRPMTLIGPAITDVAGEPAGRTQLERLIARYHWAARYVRGAVTLEVACGTGQGLGLMKEKALRVFGLDLSRENLQMASRTYGDSVSLIQGDAQRIPFADKSLDVVLLLETLYFLPDAGAFVSEAARVLKPGGKLLISSINKDCPDFNPNHPLYFAHYGAPELSALLRRNGFGTTCFGIIPMDEPSARSKAFRPFKQLAIKYNLIPDSMQARLLLKRVVFGRLTPMPGDIRQENAPTAEPLPIPCAAADVTHQVILCAGVRA